MKKGFQRLNHRMSGMVRFLPAALFDGGHGLGFSVPPLSFYTQKFPKFDIQRQLQHLARLQQLLGEETTALPVTHDHYFSSHGIEFLSVNVLLPLIQVSIYIRWKYLFFLSLSRPIFNLLFFFVMHILYFSLALDVTVITQSSLMWDDSILLAVVLTLDSGFIYDFCIHKIVIYCPSMYE